MTGAPRLAGSLTFAVGALCLPAVATVAAQNAQNAQHNDVAAQGATEVTFTRDVAPILQRSCQVCHRPGSVAPMSLLTWQQARPWARAIKQRVMLRDMPPWGVDRNVGVQQFKDDPSLTDEEIETLVAWVDGGAPRGNPEDMPPPRQFRDMVKWQIEPDLIVSMPREHTVQAFGGDETLNFITDPGFTEDRWIKAIETKPNPESFGVVHHSNTNIIEDEEANPRGTFLNEYAMGKNADVFPENSGRLLTAGSKILFNVHYYSVGEEIQSRSSVGFEFYPKGVVPKYELITQHIGDVRDDLDVPGNTVTRHDGFYMLAEPTLLTSFQPHLHSRGQRMCIEAIHPQHLGDRTRPQPHRRETLSCADYDFSWNFAYNYAEDAAPLLPAGTVLRVIAWHDNTAANKYNLDPRNWVGYGGRSIDIMSFAWVNYVYLDDEEFQRRVAARQAKPAN